MHRRLVILGLTVVLCGLLVSLSVVGEESSSKAFPTAEQANLEQYRARAVEQWSDAIAELEIRDKAEVHPDDSILFVGSSSIRRWNDIFADMAPYHPIKRGYGGAKWSDVAIFAERLITPHRFQAVVFFVGNDITGGENDRTPAEIADLFAHVLAVVRRHNAEAPVFYVAVTPTESRFSAWPEIKAGNTAVRQLCQRTKNTYFIGTESVFLNAQGKPRPELFVSDKLHLSRDGYIRWAAAITSHLDTVLNGVDMKSESTSR